MKVRVIVEDERSGAVIRRYGGVPWEILEPVMRRIDTGIEVAGRVAEARALVEDLADMLSGGRPSRRRTRRIRR